MFLFQLKYSARYEIADELGQIADVARSYSSEAVGYQASARRESGGSCGKMGIE